MHTRRPHPLQRLTQRLTQCLTLGLALTLASAGASAHDSWFERLSGGGPAGGTRLALGTGAAFPRLETPLAAEFLVQQGCQTAAGAVLPLAAEPIAPGAAHQAWLAPAGAVQCWAQSQVFDVELAPHQVAAYLDEVRASPALRWRWAQLQQAGQAWRERYSKHARIGLAAPQGSMGAVPGPVLGLDMALLNTTPPQRLQPLQVQVLRDGQPLPGLAVELRHDRARVSLWRSTDANGRFSVTPPLAGSWLLRGIHLVPPSDGLAAWQSRFVSLALEVAP